MNTLTWVIVANAAVWLGIGFYMAFLAVCQRRLANRLAQMEILAHD